MIVSVCIYMTFLLFEWAKWISAAPLKEQASNLSEAPPATYIDSLVNSQDSYLLTMYLGWLLATGIAMVRLSGSTLRTVFSFGSACLLKCLVNHSSNKVM